MTYILTQWIGFCLCPHYLLSLTFFWKFSCYRQLVESMAAECTRVHCNLHKMWLKWGLSMSEINQLLLNNWTQRIYCSSTEALSSATLVGLELGRYIENIAVYREHRYYRYCIESAFCKYRSKISLFSIYRMTFGENVVVVVFFRVDCSKLISTQH